MNFIPSAPLFDLFSRLLIALSSGMLCRVRIAPMFAVSPLVAMRFFNSARYSGVASAPMNGSSFGARQQPGGL